MDNSKKQKFKLSRDEPKQALRVPNGQDRTVAQSYRQLIYRKCKHCLGGYDLWICLRCRQPIHDACIYCHQRKAHRGQFVKTGMICRQCGGITEAPSFRMTRVYFMEKLCKMSAERINELLRKRDGTEYTVKYIEKLSKNMIHLCSNCHERLFPSALYLKVLFAMGDSFGRLRQDLVAKSFDVTSYEVKKIIKVCREKYGMDYHTLRFPQAFRFALIGGSIELDAVQRVPGEAKPRHPQAGYSFQYDLGHEDKTAGHYEGD